MLTFTSNTGKEYFIPISKIQYVTLEKIPNATAYKFHACFIESDIEIIVAEQTAKKIKNYLNDY